MPRKKKVDEPTVTLQQQPVFPVIDIKPEKPPVDLNGHPIPCRGLNSECEQFGKRCAGHARGSCGGWVCLRHIQKGTSAPFIGKVVCPTCATKQYGTLTDENSPSRGKKIKG